ncbi:MAG TPA: LLM class flavin-dependent oxidoreductase [Candidatus Limnocylindrales bacterium]|nr:LLM class flavin-dependent oxidoreductase [Candidatus Limnocylindrales bacterium]
MASDPTGSGDHADSRGRPPIGVAIGTIGATADWWLDSARRLEVAGYRGVWAWDHVMGRVDRSVPVLEQWTILAAAAGATRRIGLGTFITNVMRRHPTLIARMAGTLQAASRGRFSLGIGIGGFEGEHRAYGVDFPPVAERVARLEEAVAVIRALWTGETITRPSPFYPLAGAVARPPVEPAPRILIGAGSPAGVRLAARIGDGWAAEHPDFDRYGRAWLEAIEAAGRRRSELRLVLGFGGGRTGQNALDGSPWVEAPAEEWARWHAAGVDEVVVTARTAADIDALVGAAGRW